MKAVVKFKDGKDGWELRDIPRSDPLPGEVEIAIQAAGICGSELHLYHDNHFYTPPVVVGHEFAGIITRIGEGVTGWQVGDRVVCENNKGSCGACHYCRSGLIRYCLGRKATGYNDNGGWTDYICMPAKVLFKVPDNVTMEEAALVEPLSVVVHALCYRAPVQAGETVLVQGCGTIGLLAAMVAKAAGAGIVIITGTAVDREVRLPIARKVGIDKVIDVSETDLKAEISRITNGRGVDRIVEASGSEQAIDVSVDLLVKTMGTIVAIGETPRDKIAFRWNAAIFRSCSVIFSLAAAYKTWCLSLDFMANKKIDVKPLITHRLPLDQWEKGFQLLDSKEALKVLLIPAGSQ